MKMSSSGGANCLELQSRILGAALRQSWVDGDEAGLTNVCQSLYELFPDLLPSQTSERTGMPANYYDLLQIDCDVSPNMVLAAYLKEIRKFLRDNANPEDLKEDFYNLLNAGFILRKPRLRLSHDLIAVTSCLIESPVVPEEGALEVESTTGISKLESLPVLIELLMQAQFIGRAEVQALKNQMDLYPDIPVADLVLQCGYVTDLEMKSLKLAEYLLTSGKITMGQFAVAMYDMRNHPNPGDDFFPPEWDRFDASRVPRRPIPSSWTGGIALPLPEPDEPSAGEA